MQTGIRRRISEWLDEGDDLNVLAYRRVLHVVDDGVSTTETFRRNVRKIGSRGKVFDLCFAARQLPVAIDLAKACDNTELVLNHCGVPGHRGRRIGSMARAHRQDFGIAQRQLQAVGRSRLLRAGNATLEAINPYVEHVFDKFGSGRIVWGSDWPVVNLQTGCRIGWRLRRRSFRNSPRTNALQSVPATPEGPTT